MNPKPKKYKFLYSILVLLLTFLFVGFFMRCFPLSCEWWNFKELKDVFVKVSLPVAIIFYIFLSVIEKKNLINRKPKERIK
ncbi:MAG: hypothetical protein QXG86_02030 [Candidatus Woesearchaeota archaeon]